MSEAQFFRIMPDSSVQCSLCRHRCRILAGARGICRVRGNRDGIPESLVYGKVVAEHIDPVEKKPLFHVMPGTRTYSIATVGCNFCCRHCQNHSIAQYAPGTHSSVPGNQIPAETIVKRALDSGCRSISYTYTEPTVFFEYMLDVARLACSAGLKNIMVTNGYITPEALDALAPYIDAANIDLKGFTDDFYRRVTGARLAEVLDCIRDFHRRGIWIEITTLVIPGENDTLQQLDGIAEFISTDLNRDVPWHISRFFPQHRMTDRGATPPESLLQAVDAGRRAGLRYIYVGNYDGGLESTNCPKCGAKALSRRGYQIIGSNLDGGCCRRCGEMIAGLW